MTTGKFSLSILAVVCSLMQASCKESAHDDVEILIPEQDGVAVSDITSHDTNKSDVCKINVEAVDFSKPFISGEDINRLMDGNIIDAPINFYKAKGKVIWQLPTAKQFNKNTPPDIRVSHTLVEGTPGASDERILGQFMGEDFIVDSPKAAAFAPGSATKGKKWIANTYQTEQGVLAFTHTEYTGPNDHWHMQCDPWIKNKQFCAPGRSKIGLAWMDAEAINQEKPVYEYLGHIAGFTTDRLHFNVHGTPYIIVENDGVDYFYIFFHDDSAEINWGQIAAARAPVSEVMEAALSGTTSLWKKYNNGEWENALTGSSSSILPKVAPEISDDKNIQNARVIVHSDAVFHEDTERYFLSAYTLSRDADSYPSSHIFYDSCDGENWAFNSATNQTLEGKWGWSYLSFVDGDNDNARASGDFEMISGFDYGTPKKAMYKLKVSVPESCACPK